MGSSINSVFYAGSYHPIQAGSIDGTDTLPHDNGAYRALLCSNAALCNTCCCYHLSFMDSRLISWFLFADDPFGDPKVIGDPYCTLFVARLSHLTTEDTLRKAMNVYGRIRNLRLVRHIVTGGSRGYGFVEFETEKEMRQAYKDAHHTIIDDSEIIVDYNRQHLMPGWIPRRLGGGLGGKKESGQLRFGGRERPFRAPLRQIPWDDLKRLGIPPPPQGRYMSRFQDPSPPRRKRGSAEMEDTQEHRTRRAPSHQLEKSSSPQHSFSEDHIHKKHNRVRHSYREKKRLSSSDASSIETSYAGKEERPHTQPSHLHRHDRWTPSRDDLYGDYVRAA